MSALAPAWRRARRDAVLGAGLGVAMGLSNALGFLFVLVLSRPLGPADFGGYSALSTYGVLLAIPAGAFQVLVARHLAAPVAGSSALRPALVIGSGLAAATCVLAPALSETFALASAWSVVWLGLTLVPMMLTGCAQGLLLGSHRLAGLSALYLMTAASRLGVAALAAWRGWSVAQIFAGLLLAAILTAAFGLWRSWDLVRHLPLGGRGLARELVASNTTLVAFTVLTNVDVLLARHYLDAHASGGYALASTFGRAVCWVTQFLALLVVPRMSGPHATRRLLQASAVVLAIGLTGVAVTAAAPSVWIRLAGGAQFDGYAGLVVASVGVGTAWALGQLWLFSEMGGGRRALGLLTWAVVVAEVLAISLRWHETPRQILLVCALGGLTLALAGLLVAVRAHRDLLSRDRSAESGT